MALKTGTKVTVAVLLGLTLAIGGLISYLIFPIAVEQILKDKLVLSPSSETYKNWKDITAPIFIQFYFFNITNPMDVWAQKSKPILEEVGPYTFRETRNKENITWHENGTVSYYQKKRWYFQPDRTNGSLDDIIVTLNVPLVAAVESVKYQDDDMFKHAIDIIITETNSTIFIWKKIRELLFEGYPDPLLQEAIAMHMPNVPSDHFGWFYGKNGSADGLYSIFTGASGIENFGFIDLWEHERELNAWKRPCGTIEGTAGEMWPPFSIKRDHITFFISDICRPVTFTYQGDVDIKGVNAYRFWADDHIFDNGRLVHEHSCFCGAGRCLAPGVLNISTCQEGAPVAVSYPHFLYADSAYSNEIHGMDPKPWEHQMYMDIEPVTGVPVNVAARMQLNVFLERAHGISNLENITSSRFYPIFWFSETFTLTDDMAKQLRLVTKELPNGSSILALLLVLIGGFILIFTLFYAIRQRSKKQATQKTMYIAVRAVHSKE